MSRLLVRGALLLCLFANLIGFAHPPVTRGPSEVDLRAERETGDLAPWALLHAGQDVLFAAAQRGRLPNFSAPPRHLAMPRRPIPGRQPLAHTPHRPSAVHRHHLKLLAALARDADSPA